MGSFMASVESLANVREQKEINPQRITTCMFCGDRIFESYMEFENHIGPHFEKLAIELVLKNEEVIYFDIHHLLKLRELMGGK